MCVRVGVVASPSRLFRRTHYRSREQSVETHSENPADCRQPVDADSGLSGLDSAEGSRADIETPGQFTQREPAVTPRLPDRRSDQDGILEFGHSVQYSRTLDFQQCDDHGNR